MGVSTVSAANAKKCCLVQDALLKQVVGGIYPQNLVTKVHGMSKMLEASEAVPGVAKIDVHTPKEKPSASSATKWEIKYKAKRCAAPKTPQECDDPCGSVSESVNPWLYAQPTMSTALYEEFAVDLGNYRTMCEGSKDFLNEYLFEVYESLKAQANQRYIDQFQAQLGNYFINAADCVGAVDSGTTPATLNILNAEGLNQPRALYPVIQQYKRMGINQRPLMVGGTHLDAMAWQIQAIGAGGGTNLVLQNQQNFTGLPQVFVDYDLDATYGDANNHAFSMVPGAAFRLFWNQFDGENAYTSERLVKRTFDLGALFGDPGFVVDQSIYIDECDNCDVQVIYKFHLSTDLFWLPADAFNGTDCGQCSNYLLHWLLDCGAVDCSNFTAV